MRTAIKALATTVFTVMAIIAATLGAAPAAALPIPDATPVAATVNGSDLANPSSYSPGARWWTKEGGGSCSAGWIVNNGAHEYMYSAGHCAPKGATAMLGHTYNPVGKVVISRADTGENSGTAPVYDVSAVQIASGVPASNTVAGFGEAHRLMTRAELNDSRPDLCVVGQRTGLTCGAFIGMQSNNTSLLVRTRVDHGDSGGAVFAVSKTGEVIAVGTVAAFLKDDPDTAVVQLLDGSIDPSFHFGEL